jgi:hypothetical protein
MPSRLLSFLALLALAAAQRDPSPCSPAAPADGVLVTCVDVSNYRFQIQNSTTNSLTDPSLTPDQYAKRNDGYAANARAYYLGLFTPQQASQPACATAALRFACHGALPPCTAGGVAMRDGCYSSECWGLGTTCGDTAPMAALNDPYCTAQLAAAADAAIANGTLSCPYTTLGGRPTPTPAPGNGTSGAASRSVASVAGLGSGPTPREAAELVVVCFVSFLLLFL